MQQRTVQILKNMATINTRILFRKGVDVAIRNESSSVYAFAKVHESDTISKEFAVYDLNEFLSVLSLFDDPKIQHFDGYLTITDEKSKRMVKYVYANPNSVAETPNGGVDAIKQKDVKFSFVLSKESLESAVKASSIMRLSDMRVNDDGVVLLNQSRGSTDDGNTYQCDVQDFIFSDDAIDSVFTIAFGELKLIPDTYKVTLCPKFAIFKSAQGDLTYVVMYKIV